MLGLLEINDLMKVKVGGFTVDNATNNDTMMAKLERVLAREGISFDQNGNHIR